MTYISIAARLSAPAFVVWWRNWATATDAVREFNVVGDVLVSQVLSRC